VNDRVQEGEACKDKSVKGVRAVEERERQQLGDEGAGEEAQRCMAL